MIFFTLCPAFHGATLLSVILNNHDQILSLGDTNPILEYDQGCACGQRVSKCDFWTHIQNSLDRSGRVPVDTMLRNRPGMHNVISFGLACLARLVGKGAWVFGGQKARAFEREYKSFMDGCQKWTPHDVFIDGEKSLMKFSVLSTMRLPVGGVLHVVRDPRGYVVSAMKYGIFDTVEAAAKDWVAYHKKIERCAKFFARDRVFRIHYEALADWNSFNQDDLASFLGVDVDETLANPPKNPRKHHLMGNKMLSQFDGTIQLDEKWREVLSQNDLGIINKVAGTYMRKFGYED